MDSHLVVDSAVNSDLIMIMKKQGMIAVACRCECACPNSVVITRNDHLDPEARTCPSCSEGNHPKGRRRRMEGMPWALLHAILFGIAALLAWVLIN